METEFKYRLDDPALAKKILNDPMLDDYVDRDQLEEIHMHAVYFDTEDQDLRKAGIAYRIRYENDRITATIKWDNRVEAGLHSREEFNLVINDERFAEAPDIEAFESSDAYEVLLAAAGHKKLHKIVEMDFIRNQIKVNTGDSISELSFDDGVIHGVSGEVRVQEMELEWYYGDEDDFCDIAQSLAEKYSLEPENISKLQRGFMPPEDAASE
ncbi:MAG: CYTH domain-containing protein [Mogibacterium sp.]|nr:CYTH domain-containing protein [Mogibacterium sp.]